MGHYELSKILSSTILEVTNETRWKSSYKYMDKTGQSQHNHILEKLESQFTMRKTKQLRAKLYDHLSNFQFVLHEHVQFIKRKGKRLIL